MRPKLSPGLDPGPGARPASQRFPVSAGAISEHSTWPRFRPIMAAAIERVRVRTCRLAHHAGPDGAGAFPPVTALVRCTGLSERTVRTYLDRLEAVASIAPCDPDLVAARIKRADHCPQTGTWTSPWSAAISASSARPFRQARPRLAATGQALVGVQAGPGRGRPSRTSSVREVMPSLVKTFRRW